MQTTVQLFINGQEADFTAFMSVIVEKALAAVSSIAPSREAEFSINPKMMYSLADINIQKILNVDTLKHPSQAALYAFRTKGISPITTNRRPAQVFGSQILEYFEKIQSEQTNFTKSN